MTVWTPTTASEWAPPARDPSSKLYQLPEWPGQFNFRDRGNQWASTEMMLFLSELIFAWYMGPGMVGQRPIGIGDISLSNGHQPGGHATHRDGLRIDFCCMHIMPSVRRYEKKYMITHASPFYDRAAMVAFVTLIRKLLEGRYKVAEIYYNDPAVQAVWPERITSLVNHDEHLHLGLWPGHPYGSNAETLLSLPMPLRQIGF